ncbi:uncharacterized protein LOC143465361 [Clavelina lepadiformis]|uniref:uncharacterized protein LOC143465361 n=1 Tax=Clavelina lepadiformis TaxID=159417 RepID=UPI004041024D
MRTVTFCPGSKKYTQLVTEPFRRIHRITIYIVLSWIILLASCFTNYWISVCAPFSSSGNAFDLYHKELQEDLQTTSYDTHQMCLNIGLFNGALSVPHLPTSFVYIGDKCHAMVKVSAVLMLITVLILPISAIVSFLCYFEIFKRRFVIVSIIISVLFLFAAVIIFTIYKERTAMVDDPEQDVIKDLLNNFHGSYGLSYYLAWLSLFSTCATLNSAIVFYHSRNDKNLHKHAECNISVL